MSNYRDILRPRPSSATYHEQLEVDPEFPPIRIGNDIPLILVPPGAPHRNRYRRSAEEATMESNARNGATLNVSKALNQPLSPVSSKKVYDLCSLTHSPSRSLLYINLEGLLWPECSGRITSTKAAAQVRRRRESLRYSQHFIAYCRLSWEDDGGGKDG